MTISEARRMIQEGYFICVLNNRSLIFPMLFGTAKDFYEHLEPKIVKLNPQKTITTIYDFVDVILQPELRKISPISQVDVKYSFEFEGKNYPMITQHVYPNTTFKGLVVPMLETSDLEHVLVKIEIPKEKVKTVYAEELQDDALRVILKNVDDFIDEYGPILIAQLWMFGITDLNITEEERQQAMELLSFQKEDRCAQSFVFYALTHRKIRYTARHDAIKLLAGTEQKRRKAREVQLLENGFVKTRLCLSEEHQKALNHYHLTALFDLLYRLTKMKKIRDRFAVAKGSMDIESEDVAVITNRMIKEFLGVNEYEANQIKKAIYDLTQLILLGETKDGTIIGVYPIRKVGFIENKRRNKRIDVFEIDSMLLKNGRRFVPMLPQSFSRLFLMPLPGKEKKFVSNVYLYLLETRNFKTGESYISARSFSERFPSSYGEQRRWGQLNQKIEKALKVLSQLRMIRGYECEKDYFIVRLRD